MQLATFSVLAAPARFENAVTKRVKVADAIFVFRLIGAGSGVPIVFLHHFGGVLDDWDPAVIDALAKSRRVIVFDNRGVGESNGKTPDTIEAMAADAIAFVTALGLKQVDLVAFSAGGFVAQVMAHDRPDLVRRLVLAGTGPEGGEGIGNIAAVVNKHPKHFLFFPQTRHGQQAADAFLERLSARKVDRDVSVREQTLQAQLSAIKKWGEGVGSERRLQAIKQPVLVVSGDNDLMVPTINSTALFHALPNAELSILPHAGHGAIFQYHREFVAQALRFFAD